MTKGIGSLDEAAKTWAAFMDWMRGPILTGAEGSATLVGFTMEKNLFKIEKGNEEAENDQF